MTNDPQNEDMELRLEKMEALGRRAQRHHDALKPLFHRVAELRRRAAAPTATAADREALDQAEDEARRAVIEFKVIEEEMIAASGLPPELIDELERRQAVTGDDEDRRPRESVTSERVEPTGWIEDLLPSAVESLRLIIPPDWLREQRQHSYRLAQSFRTKPLTLVRGIRARSEVRSIHRFAQMLSVAEDLLDAEPEYDFFAGATLVPQLLALAGKLEALDEVAGEVDQRISSLWRLPSETAESTVYELVVAGACASRGRAVEFLPAGTTGGKVPDMRVHDYAFPLVIECKRRQLMTDLDRAEEEEMSALFAELHGMARQRGMYGRFDLRLVADHCPRQEVITAASRQRFAPDPRSPTAYEWGELAWQPSPARASTPPTRLYSPVFLNHVFGWDTDMPEADGLICQVSDPGDLLVDEARDPIGITWTNDSEAGFRRRARTAAANFGQALRQVPGGEVAVVYIAYHEGDRPPVADDRTRYMEEKLQDWRHRWEIRVPITVLHRLVSRPLGHGLPDMVETGIQFVSKEYGDPSWFQDFPTTVYTR